jgi:transcriptional regulator of arginine metabolism
MNEYSKQDRQRLLKEIIDRQEIGDQSHLLEALKSHGIEATQATVSRDLQEMSVAKVRVRSGVYKYQVIEKVSNDIILDKLKVLFDNFVTDLKSTTNLLLVKTSPGNANGVASFIDRLGWPEILGTIAGDDTILVVVDNEENRLSVERRFHAFLHHKGQESPQ